MQDQSDEAQKFGISGGRVQNLADVIMDPAFARDLYTPELYENASHVSGAGASWRLNTGPGYFRIRLHLLDWWHGGDRRYFVVVSSGNREEKHLVCTPENKFARIDEFFFQVEPSSTTLDLRIVRDDSLAGDSFPCFSGFEVQRMVAEDDSSGQDSVTQQQLKSTRTRKSQSKPRSRSLDVNCTSAEHSTKPTPRLVPLRPKTSNVQSKCPNASNQRTAPSCVRRVRSACQMQSLDAQCVSESRSSSALPSDKSKTVRTRCQGRSMSRSNWKVRGSQGEVFNSEPAEVRSRYK